MSLMKLAASAVATVALVLLFGGAVMAANGPPPAPRDGGEDARDVPPRASAPSAKPEFEPGRPPGRFSGRGPGQPDNGRMRRPGPHGPPSAGPGKRPGPPDQRGPRRPGHPMGPPRWPHHNWDALQKGDPEMYKLLKDDHDLERQARELAIQHRRAPADRRAAVKQKLEELVARHFDVRQQRRQLELKRLEEELERLRGAIERRNKARRQIVEQRTSELLGEKGLDF